MTTGAVAIRCDDVAASLAEAIQLISGFTSYSQGWAEPDPSEYPSVGSVFVGEVGEVEVSVAKLRSGSAQLTFAFDAEDEELDEGEVTCAVAWLMPGAVLDFDEAGEALFPTSFQAEGYLWAILENEELMSALRQTDDILGRLLFGDPWTFMTLEAKCTTRDDDEPVSIQDEEFDGKNFIRDLICQVGMATPYSAV